MNNPKEIKINNSMNNVKKNEILSNKSNYTLKYMFINS